MQDLDKTTRFTGATSQVASSLVTIFDSNSAPYIICSMSSEKYHILLA